MAKPVPDDELNAFLQSVAGRPWEESELMGKAIEMLTRQRLYIEQQNELVRELMPTIELQQRVMLEHGII